MINSPIKKLLEAIILETLEEKLVRTGRLHKTQTGFIPGCGTSVNLLKFIGDISDIKKRNSSLSKYYIGFIDFKAAFDSVVHQKLYGILESAGIDEITISRVKLLYNCAYFSVDGRDRRPINVGVPQGSLLSPILFNLYIDELLRTLSRELGERNVYCYADDLMFICLGKYSLNRSIRTIKEWGAANNLFINPKKCAIMRVRKRLTRKDELEGAVQEISFKNSYKYLGVQVEASLTLQSHFKAIKQKLAKVTPHFFKLKQGLTGVKVRLELWQTYLTSIIEYGVESLALFPKKLMKLESMYYSSLKFALGVQKSVNSHM